MSKPRLTDPDKIKRMEASFPISPAEMVIIEQRIRKAAERKEDVGWLNYLFNTLLWNKVIKKNARMDKKTLYFIMSHFDELAVFMPSPFWIEVTKVIDKMGTELYKQSKAGDK